MLSRSSRALRPFVRSPLPLVSHPLRNIYTNQNKPESKANSAKSVADAKAGKSAQNVEEHRQATGGGSLKPETIRGMAKETKTKAEVSEKDQPINRPDAGPDVLREKDKPRKHKKGGGEPKMKQL